jgi:hypothetical protein
MPWLQSDRDEVLKEYPNLKDFLPYLDELNNESPRGKVLISTGYLEQLLKEILSAFLLKDKVVSLCVGARMSRGFVKRQRISRDIPRERCACSARSMRRN